MPIEIQKTRTWDLDTPNSGLLLDAEFDRIYENFKYVKNTLDLPVGTILMYDGTGWIDPDDPSEPTNNPTLHGWYACIPENAGQGCPDMTDRFVMGKIVSGSGATGGQNSVTLVEANLPAHTHTINHDHTACMSSTNGNHYHNVHVYYNQGAGGLPLQGLSTYAGCSGTTSTTGNHNHSVDLANYTGTSGSTGSDTDFDNRPLYYSMIFIRRCV